MNSVKLQGTRLMPPSQLFLYTSSEQYEQEIKKAVPFTVVSERIKYLRINSTSVLSRMIYRFRQSLSKPQWSIKKIFYLSVWLCLIVVAWGNLSLWHVDCLLVSWTWASVVLALKLSYLVACRILVPWPGIEPASPALQGRYLPPGSSGKSPSGVILQKWKNSS